MPKGFSMTKANPARSRLGGVDPPSGDEPHLVGAGSAALPGVGRQEEQERTVTITCT